MRLPRIFVDGPLVAAQQMELPAAASQHLLAVLRLRVGAPIRASRVQPAARPA